MIVKYYELKKKNIENFKFFLLYGNNLGLIQEATEHILRPKLPEIVNKYEETEILKNIENFKEQIFNKSFFENEKLIILNRVSEKIVGLIEELIEKDITDLYFIILSKSLDKKSKLRNLFEKNKKTICIPFYEDTDQVLSQIVEKFMREKKISISRELINLIAEKARGDRINLKNELTKIENYTLKKKKLDITDIIKITNLSENYSVSELVDSCLSKNKTKILKILNENKYNSEDCIVILKTFLLKLKRLIKLQENLNIKNQNIDSVISSYKPPIFWKEKEIIKKQIRILNYRKTKELISKTSEIELMIKKNPQSSLNITTDFVISHLK
tara:strand:+ start:4143 stop:5129 length:987 start_codon:yes stop_codon:yes gene_type:complete